MGTFFFVLLENTISSTILYLHFLVTYALQKTTSDWSDYLPHQLVHLSAALDYRVFLPLWQNLNPHYICRNRKRAGLCTYQTPMIKNSETTHVSSIDSKTAGLNYKFFSKVILLPQKPMSTAQTYHLFVGRVAILLELLLVCGGLVL